MKSNTRSDGGHLSRIDLARLVDEAPAPDERRHLETCSACMEELAALTAQTRALGGLAPVQPAPEAWAALEERLRDEGLMEAVSSRHGTSAPVELRAPAAPVRSRWGRRRGWLQAAAGVALFVAGGISGSLVTTRGAGEPGAGAELGASVTEPRGSGAVPAAAVPEVVPADSEPSLRDSETLVRQAEDLYMQALLGYRDQLDRSDNSVLPRDPVGRLVMLENLLAASEAAVREDPADPFFNGLLVNTAAEHRATLEAMTSANTVSW
jgi:hypothetical protein